MKRISGLLIGFILCTGLTACSFFQRHADSGYYQANGYGPVRDWSSQHLEQERRQYEVDRTKEELGWDSSRSLSEEDAQALQLRLAVNRLESQLETEKEKRQYYQYKGSMKSDQERIYFLQLPTMEARETWATNQDYGQEEAGYSDEVADLIEESDVALGMSQKAVMESWGDPDTVEVAGNSMYGNERWRYSRYISSNEGYQKVEKILYFESGKLAGWETY